MAERQLNSMVAPILFVHQDLSDLMELHLCAGREALVWKGSLGMP